MTLRVTLFTTGTRFERRMKEGFGTALRAATGTSTFVEPVPPDRSSLLTRRRGCAWHQQAKPHGLRVSGTCAAMASSC